MAIVVPQDLATYLGTDVDTARATMILADAEAMCTAILAPLPVTAAPVIRSIAARAYANPEGVTAETAGPFSVQRPAGLYLTRDERRTLWRLSGKGGAFSINVENATAGTGLAPWDQNVTWLEGVPLAEDPIR